MTSLVLYLCDVDVPHYGAPQLVHYTKINCGPARTAWQTTEKNKSALPSLLTSSFRGISRLAYLTLNLVVIVGLSFFSFQIFESYVTNDIKTIMEYEMEIPSDL